MLLYYSLLASTLLGTAVFAVDAPAAVQWTRCDSKTPCKGIQEICSNSYCIPYSRRLPNSKPQRIETNLSRVKNLDSSHEPLFDDADAEAWADAWGDHQKREAFAATKGWPKCSTGCGGSTRCSGGFCIPWTRLNVMAEWTEEDEDRGWDVGGGTTG